MASLKDERSTPALTMSTRNSVTMRWEILRCMANGLPPPDMRGVRDFDFPCEGYAPDGYDGRGQCQSDGHYMCKECRELSPSAPRFDGREGRRERLLLFWARRERA